MRALDNIPDEPAWVDLRSSLLAGGRVIQGADGFVVLAPGGALLGVRGRPGEAALRQALERAADGAELLACDAADAEAVEQALGAAPETATIAAAEELAAPPAPDGATVRLYRPGRPRPPLDPAPEELQRELAVVFSVGPVAVAFVDGRAVSFCYPAAYTKRWWDVGVDTLEPFRGRGLAAAVFHAMAREMALTGRRPVWGALDSNVASRRLAAKLGFQPVGRLWLWRLDSRSARPGFNVGVS